MNPPVLSVREARAGLSSTLAAFRRDGGAAAPVLLGSQRRPEAAIIPFDMYERLAGLLDDLEIAETVQARLSAPASQPMSVTAEKLGIDLDAL